MLSLEGVVTAVTSAITGAVLSTSKNGESSEPQELTTSAILEIRKNNKFFASFTQNMSVKNNKPNLEKNESTYDFLSLSIFFNKNLCRDLFELVKFDLSKNC